MYEISIIELLTIISAIIFLIAGLAIRWHKNTAIFLYSCYFITSDIINPIFFIKNQNSYTYEGWAAVRSFDFSMMSFFKSYSGSYFIFSVIIFLSVLFSFSGILQKSPQRMTAGIRINNKSAIRNNNAVLYLFCFTLLPIYYFLYNYKIAITGVAGELPFHLSGAIHYLRIYVFSIILALLVGKSHINYTVIFTIFLYAFVTGVAASSRLVVVITISILVFNLAYNRRFFLVFVSLFFTMVMWFVISVSRELTFSEEHYNLFEVIYYALTEQSWVNVINTLDALTGRLSGAQQIVLAYQLRGIKECSLIVDFFMGRSVCTDTVAVVYGLDLSGTSYGLGLSIIPSILISGKGMLAYFFPAVIVSFFISLTEYIYRTMVFNMRSPSIGFLYLFLSVTFLFTGPLLYYYYLQFALFCGFIVYKTYKKMIKTLKYTVKNSTKTNYLNSMVEK